MIKQVGVIGLGKMGLPMAGHMVRKGYAVSAYDINEVQMSKAAALGVKICKSPAEVAANSHLIIIVVGFDSEVLQTLRAEDGIYAGARTGSIIAVSSTCYAETMQTIQDDVEKLGKNLKVLDIPTCRSERAAVDGTLLVLGGGDASVFKECEPVFASFATDIALLGGLGAGQVGKMINNLLLWSCIAANFEGLKLGAAMGLDEKKLREALLKSSGRNWALETWDQPRAMPWAEKDMTIVAHEADRFKLSMPMSGVVKEVIKSIKKEWGMATPVVTGAGKK
jgi:3-hydroxyisobutyrate dehydrogenase-like beta-hydroxyacid dehydrogenase